MKSIVARVLYSVVIVGGIILFISGFLAYFVRSYDAQTGIYYDGLGRGLELVPTFARIFLTPESLWAGWGYFILDAIIFWGSIGIGGLILSKANDLSKDSND